MINKILPSDIKPRFTVDESTKSFIFNLVNHEIDQWQGTKLKEEAKSVKDIIQKARTWYKYTYIRSVHKLLSTYKNIIKGGIG